MLRETFFELGEFVELLQLFVVVAHDYGGDVGALVLSDASGDVVEVLSGGGSMVSVYCYAHLILNEVSSIKLLKT